MNPYTYSYVGYHNELESYIFYSRVADLAPRYF
jgi:hypothetical protein